MPREAARIGGRAYGSLLPAGRAQPPEGLSAQGAGRFRLCTCGTRRAAARALPRALPVTGGPPSRSPTAPAGYGHHPGAPVLSRRRSPSRALARARVLRMALRATPDCDLPRFISAPVGRMAGTGC
jgi:hypothetical protein